jgi:hypothetical protein
MMPGTYLYHVAYAADLLANAVLAGDPDQTVSSRCYEAAIIQGRWWWFPLYWYVNINAYVLRWTIGRLLGHRFGVDMPVNHCMDAYCNASIGKDDYHTYND